MCRRSAAKISFSHPFQGLTPLAIAYRRSAASKSTNGKPAAIEPTWRRGQLIVPREAIAAGAFWRVKGDKPFSVSMLFDHRFLMAFLIPVSMHAIWDAPWQLPFLGNDILTGLISWYVVFGLVQQGLHQVKDEQKTHLQTTLNQVEASLQIPGTVTV